MTKQIPFLEVLREELIDRADAPFGPQRGRPKPGRTLAIAVASFVGTLLLGSLAWFIASMGSEPAALNPLDELEWDLAISLPAPDNSAQFLTALEELPGVASIVEYFPDQSVLYPSQEAGPSDSSPETTVVEPVGESEPPVVAMALITIEETHDASHVAIAIESAFDVYSIEFSRQIAGLRADEFWEHVTVGAEILDDDPVFLQPPPGPEPLFDTSQLGDEVILVAATSGDSVPERLTWPSADQRGGLAVEFTRPVVNIGSVPEMGATLVIHATSEWAICESVLDVGSMAGGCDDFSRGMFGVTNWGGSEFHAGHAVVRVPPETSVAQFSVNDGPPLWQRPVAGYSLFPTEAVNNDTAFRVTAYDQDGDVIGQWVTDN